MSAADATFMAPKLASAAKRLPILTRMSLLRYASLINANRHEDPTAMGGNPFEMTPVLMCFFVTVAGLQQQRVRGYSDSGNWAARSGRRLGGRMQTLGDIRNLCDHKKT